MGVDGDREGRSSNANGGVAVALVAREIDPPRAFNSCPRRLVLTSDDGVTGARARAANYLATTWDGWESWPGDAAAGPARGTARKSTGGRNYWGRIISGHVMATPEYDVM